MIPLLTNAGRFIGQRFVHFMVYLLIGLLTIGVPYKLFMKDTSKTIIKADKYYADTCKPQVFVGCGIHRAKVGVIWERATPSPKVEKQK